LASSLVRLAPLAAPPSCDRKLLENAFGQRRKMLGQSLRSLGADVTALLSAADLSPMARAEDIPIDGFVSLARALAVQHALRHDAGA
jgi:16S rRNA (adenine1518-N6/adenine1519-N6)-dimethyltransferase